MAWAQLPPWLQYVGELLFFCVVFHYVQNIGQLFAANDINPTVTPVRPASGVTLAIILWRGYRLWPAMWLTGAFSHYHLTHDWIETLGVPTGGCMEALAGVWLVRHFVGPRIDFGSIKSVLGFLWWGGVVRAAMTTTWTIGFLLWRDRLPVEQMPLAWTTNFFGSAMGVAVFGSFILSWVQPASTRDSEASIPETVLLFGLLILAVSMDYLSQFPLTFLSFPLLVWAGLRLGPRALTAAVMTVVLVALTFVASGYKAFGLIDGNPDELQIWLQIFIVCVAGTGLVLGAVAAQRRRTLRATAELSSFQKAMLDGSNFSVIVTDDHGAITSVNRGAERLLGYTENELLGRPLQCIHDPAEIAQQTLLLSADTGRKIGGFEALSDAPRRGRDDEREWTYVRKDGRHIPVFSSITLLSPVDGRPRGFLATGVDITARKLAEAQMEAAKTAAEQANRSKSEFLANISHEIRTPMNSVLGFAELLQRHLRDPGMKKQAQAIFSSGQTLLRLINDLLDLSKVEAGRLELQPAPVDVRSLATEMGQFFSLKAEEKGLAIVTRFSGPLDGQFQLDEVRVRQVLFNLIGNAIKFTEHGQVVLSVKAEAEAAGHSLLHFEVTDTGVGIPSEHLSLLFQPFEQRSGQNTRKYGGTGLGLSISRRLAELMGGTLLACSETGTGSTFCLTIPHVRHEAEPASPLAMPDVRPIPNILSGVLQPEGLTPLTPAAIAAWQVCAELAAGPWMKTWKNLMQTPLFEDVEQFGTLLASAANEDTPSVLREYGRRLADQARDFEVEEMTHSLREFPQLAARLQRGPNALSATVSLGSGER